VLGRRAHNAAELLEGIRAVPASSIYYHTHRFLLEHHYLLPEPSNDFAYWLTKILGLVRLGERLASIDVVAFDTIEKLRAELATILGDEVPRLRRMPECPEGEEFHFMLAKTAVLSTPIFAHTVDDFIEAMGRISINSLYYHFFEARLRLGGEENDFELWLRGIGENDYAERISKLDPYTMTLEELRQTIIKIGRRRRARG
jgi:hypothetical protein